MSRRSGKSILCKMKIMRVSWEWMDDWKISDERQRIIFSSSLLPRGSTSTFALTREITVALPSSTTVIPNIGNVHKKTCLPRMSSEISVTVLSVGMPGWYHFATKQCFLRCHLISQRHRWIDYFLHLTPEFWLPVFAISNKRIKNKGSWRMLRRQIRNFVLGYLWLFYTAHRTTSK